MIIPSTGNVYFFETQKDIEVSGPYATISAKELGAIVQRFVSWKTMLETHPKLAETLGDISTAHIILTNEVGRALAESQRQNMYPNIIVPMHTFTTAMRVMSISRAVVLQPEFGEVLAEETRKWEAS